MTPEAHETTQFTIAVLGFVAVVAVIGTLATECEATKRRTRTDCIRAGHSPIECRVVELGS